MVDRPTKAITEATEKIMAGDFSVRIQPMQSSGMEGFNRIAMTINQMAEELGSVETLRTDFIANVSHEMKTPLAVMNNYGTLLQAPDLSEEKRMENKEGFTYTYSAKEQEEIKAIRKKYAVQEQTEDKMAQLRRLDAGVYSKATTASLVVGIIGALMMGSGMSLVMTDIGEMLGTVLAMVIGIGVGVIGIGLVCLAYPIYNRTLKKEREKIAPEIIRLTDELMK